MLTDLEQFFVNQPDILKSLVIGGHDMRPSARMIYGMAAHGGTEIQHHYEALHRTFEDARNELKGYDRKHWGWDEPMRGEPVEFFRTNDFTDSGDGSSTLWFRFDPSKVENWPEGPEFPWDDADAVSSWLADYYGVGVPCTCGVCLQGGDCCGRWFPHSLEVWPAQEPRRVYPDGSDASHDWNVRGNWGWYGKISYSRNI